MVLQKPQEQDDHLPPPRTLILDFTLTNTRYDSSHVHTTGQLTNTRRLDGSPELDGTLREVVRKKSLHYLQLYINRPDPIVFLPAAVDTTGRLYDDFSRLLFPHAHREASSLPNEIPEESDQFRFLRADCYVNIKGSVGSIDIFYPLTFTLFYSDVNKRTYVKRNYFVYMITYTGWVPRNLFSSEALALSFHNKRGTCMGF